MADVHKYGQEELDNLKKVLESGNFADHDKGFMAQFRKDFGEVYESKHVILAATAMLAMMAIPPAIGAGPGDEIICDPLVQFHAIACLHTNVVPVWSELRADNFLMDADKVEEKITKRTKAIWVTHYAGFAAEVDKLRAIADKHGIYLLEDCAHVMLGEYKGKKLGKWGHIGTFSLNQGKQIMTGEGGIAITDDSKLAMEIDKRIIFGATPEVLSSNYRMTEFQAAVGVVQLKKAREYIDEFLKAMKELDKAIEGCEWLIPRQPHDGTAIAPYFWTCIFHGEKNGISYNVFKAALKQVGAQFHTGAIVQRPAYLYNMIRTPLAYNNKGCPYNCHLYDGKIDWHEGLCPVAEEVIPRVVLTNCMISCEKAKIQAKLLKEAIKLTESGNVKPLEYSDTEKKILQIVKENSPIQPYQVSEIFDKNGWEHITETGMMAAMDDLLDRFPYRLSKNGPRFFGYHDLS